MAVLVIQDIYPITIDKINKIKIYCKINSLYKCFCSSYWCRTM